MKGESDILIVEDENIVALDMRMRLEAMGYNVVDVVETASQAIERASALGPDLVLMDIKLKGEQDGIEAAGRLRELVDLPVIFVTAFTDERTLERAKHASPYGYIVKPFHERELRIAIELALYKHQYELSIMKAKEIAEEANRVKGEFLANMSHELKTPLNSVIGFTELARSVSKDPEQDEYLAIALSSAKSLLTLIDSILDFAQMEAGKLAAVALPFSLDALLGECADSLAMRAFSKGLEVNLKRDPRIPDALVGDSSLLRHILLNLLDNAVKFTEKGRIRLGARLSEGPVGAGRRPVIEFEVADTGIGMPKDKLGAAFARFTQLDPSRTRKAGGTGLGLAIVDNAVELLNGTLSVESEEGVGTRFLLSASFEHGTGAALPQAHVKAVLAEEAIVAGFDDEGFDDASVALSRLGLSARRAGSLEAASGDEASAEASGRPLVVADERAAASLNDRVFGLLSGRLIVGTRFGASTRIKLGGRDGLAFAPLPLRAENLRAAIDALAADAACRASSEPRTSSAPPSPVTPSPADKLLLLKLAEDLEASEAGDSFAAAERAAKVARGALAEIGDGFGSRLVFSAILLARKGDAAGLKSVAEKIRVVACGQRREG